MADLFCTCNDCLVRGSQVKMGEIVTRNGSNYLVVTDKRHGARHSMVLDRPTLDKLMKAVLE